MFSKHPHLKTTVVIAMLAGFIALSGCSSAPKRSHSVAKKSTLFPKSIKQTSTQKRLAKHFRSWQRTPYRLGGISKRGVDCSGFVKVIYRDVFSRTIPRSTELLAKAGKRISQKNLKLGDLVFFKTGRKVRHVGVYVGRGNFIHASTSRGVMQSNLGSSYWKKHYWMAKRILS
jgi:cell wall-associated NlpC family hydrolase